MPRNFFQVVRTLPAYGIGSRLFRRTWERNNYEETYWTVTRLQTSPNGKRVKAYGRLTWRGVEEPREREIRCAFKREWKAY